MGVVIRQSIKATIANYVGIGIGFITTFFILTHYLTQEEIGLTRVLVDASVLLSGLAQLGTSSSLMRFYPYFKDPEKKDHGIFFWSLLVPFVGFFIVMLLLFLFKGAAVNFFSAKSPLFVQYFYFIVPLSFSMLYQSVFETNANILMRITVPKLIREVGIRLGLLVSYVLFGLDIINLNGLVIAFCVIYFLAAVLNFIYVCIVGKVSFKPDFKFLTPKLVKSMILYSGFITLSAIIGNVTPVLNSFFVTAKMGLVYTGIFAIATYIATIIDIPSRSLNAIVQPQLSAALKDNDSKSANALVKKVSLHELMAGLFIFILIWINLDLIFGIMPNGDSYLSGKSVVCILALSRLCYVTFQIGLSGLSYSRYYYLSLGFSILLTVLAIVFNNTFIPRWGMNGAAYATLFSYLVYYLLMTAVVWRKVRVSPFSAGQLKVLAVTAAMLVLNYCIATFVSVRLPLGSLVSQIAEGVVRSAVVVGLGVLAVYKWRISGEFNSLMEKVLGIKKNKV